MKFAPVKKFQKKKVAVIYFVFLFYFLTLLFIPLCLFTSLKSGQRNSTYIYASSSTLPLQYFHTNDVNISMCKTNKQNKQAKKKQPKQPPPNISIVEEVDLSDTSDFRYYRMAEHFVVQVGSSGS